MYTFVLKNLYEILNLAVVATISESIGDRSCNVRDKYQSVIDLVTSSDVEDERQS